MTGTATQPYNATAPAPGGPIHWMGYCLALVTIFVLPGRLVEFLPAGLHPAILLLFAGSCFAVASGGIQRVFASPSLRWLGAFTVWSILGLPFAVWRGGAVRIWLQYWLASLMVCIIVTSLVVTVEECRKALYALATAMLALFVLSLSFASDTMGGRYNFDRGSLGNANTLALVYLMGAPFCVLAIARWKGILKAPPLVCLVVMVVSVLRTGSRAGLLSLTVLLIITFLRASPKGKIGLLAGVMAVVAASGALLSNNARERLKTLFAGDALTANQISAMESSASRRALLERSIKQTLLNPVFGTGMGMFQVADAEITVLGQDRARWHVSHNSYTQLSSETGIPGLIFYAAALVSCWRRMRAAEKGSRGVPQLAGVGEMAFYIRLSLTAYAITSAFASTAYECYFPMLASLAACCDLVFRSAMDAHRRAAAGAEGSPGMAPMSWRSGRRA